MKMTKKRRLAADMNYHYTYRITNIKEGKYYYGVHSCDCLPKEDIGIKYWSSFKKKEFIKDQKENPQNYKYKVIKIFSTRVEAVQHEIFLHAKFDVKLHPKFYNESNQTSTGFDTTGKAMYINENGIKEFLNINDAKERNLKGCTSHAAWNKGLKMPEEYNIMMKYIFKTNRRSYIGEGNPNYGKTTSDETKEKIRQGNLGKTISEESKLKMSISRSGELHWNYGKTHSEETKLKMRKPRTEEAKQNMKKAKQNMPIKICPYCGKEGRGGNMTRYHFDNCKQK